MLQIPCLVEDCLPEIGLAAVAVLERLGFDVEHPAGQTCCGQLAYKTGDVSAARALAKRMFDLFPGPDPVVSPSGSCAKMLRTYPQLFRRGTTDYARALDLAGRTYELCAFLASQPAMTRLAPTLRTRACLHRSCQLEGSDAPARVLGQVRGLTLLDPARPDRCCGFGGLFSVQFPSVSEALLEEKVDEILATQPDLIVTAEPSCLMNISGYLARQGGKVPVLHVAQVLAKALGDSPWTA
jgi:L-lactate dehydrogenase complex protein LldE